MRTSRFLVTTAVTAALMAALSPVAASAEPGATAVNVLTYGSLGGPNVASGDRISAPLKSGTTSNFYSSTSGTTGVVCTTSNFNGTVGTNPVAPGIATGTLNSQTFSNCTENITGVTSVQSVAVDPLPFNVTFNSSTNVVTLTGSPLRATIKLNTVLGLVTCVYHADNNTISGTSSNADNSIRFVNQQFNKFSGPSTCFTNGYFTATYAPVTGPGGLVFVN